LQIFELRLFFLACWENCVGTLHKQLAQRARSVSCSYWQQWMPCIERICGTCLGSPGLPGWEVAPTPHHLPKMCQVFSIFEHLPIFQWLEHPRYQTGGLNHGEDDMCVFDGDGQVKLQGTVLQLRAVMYHWRWKNPVTIYRTSPE